MRGACIPDDQMSWATPAGTVMLMLALGEFVPEVATTPSPTGLMVAHNAWFSPNRLKSSETSVEGMDSVNVVSPEDDELLLPSTEVTLM